ncbi:hypothetical protein BG015_006185 [Linnemannia schmuckeri]|uniref:Uncharacterized protein n=1 Tax=Linnemannia schmuckeri TaxID=64567 RepID=A0A9P5UUR2_9FUNG|nr:hypothetical protein BG015_006185 [Linnemannia schmuckeri]
MTETIARTEAKNQQLKETVARTEAKNQQLMERVRHLDNIVEEQAQRIANLKAHPVLQPHSTAPQVSPDNNEGEDDRVKKKEEEFDGSLGWVEGEAQDEDVVMEEDGANAGRHSVLFKDEIMDTIFDLVAHSCNQPASADISVATAADVADTYPSFPRSFRPIFRKWIKSEADRPSVWALETSHPLWRRRFTAARQTTFSREKKAMRRFLDLVRDADPASPIRTRVRMAVRRIEREIHEAGTLAQFLSTFD